MKEKTTMVKLTGLWKNTGKDGKTYLTGTVNPGAKLLVMPNTFKKKDSDPDYYAYVAPSDKREEPKEDAGSDTL